MAMTPEALAEVFGPARGRIYLDAATYGLPPKATVRAMRRAIAAWQAGTGHWIEDWDSAAEDARDSIADLLGVERTTIATLPAASVGVGLVAQSLRAGDEVVVPVDEFASVLHPLLVAEQRGIRVRQVTLEGLPEAIGGRTTLVATSVVQMQTGRAAPVADVMEAARRYGTRILLDATQSLPVTPFPCDIAGVDYLVAAGYKHLLCPRGTAFLYVRPEALDTLAPIDANWRSTDQPYARYFGGPLRPAPGALRFDVSQAWFSWVGARESLRLLADWQRDRTLGLVRRHAARLAAGLGVDDPGTTLVCVAVDDQARLARALRGARIRAAIRGSALRLSPHLHNAVSDIDRAIEVVAPFVAGAAGRRPRP
jgi:selenocysteine lyase/cysteine desulfurase